MFGTCCWLRGKVAARELEALGYADLGNRMFTNIGPDEARDLGAEMLAAADALEQKHAKDAEPPKGAGWDGTWDEQTEAWVWQTHSRFSDALADIRTAGRWYLTCARLGYGVHAWY